MPFAQVMDGSGLRLHCEHPYGPTPLRGQPVESTQLSSAPAATLTQEFSAAVVDMNVRVQFVEEPLPRHVVFA